MSTNDVIPDIPPDQERAEETSPLASSPNQVLVYIGVTIPLLIFHRLAWEALKYMIVDRILFLQQISDKLLFIWFIPILGLVSSIIVPSLGGTLGWVIAISVLAGLPLLFSAPFALLFGVDNTAVPS